jgi:outer membrane protein assembly factor BamB
MLGPTSLAPAKRARSTTGRTLRGRGAAPRRALLGAALLGCLLWGLLAGPLTISAYAGEPAWTTYHRDAGRSGADPEALEPIIPKLAWQSLDLGAPIWGQSLILGSRVYVATVGNQIYALDASTGKVIWEKSAGTPVPSHEVTCGDIKPTVGIVGTPVIDVSTNAIYAVADTWNASTKEVHHMLQGYDLTSGAQVLSTAVDPPGADPKKLLERPALNLDQGKVVFGFGGNAGDCGEYRGAIVAAPEAGGPPSFWQYTPASPAFGGGAVWGTSGPAVDGEGHIYVSTGNPNFPKGQEVGTYDSSDSIVELNSSMGVIGNFEPESWLADSNHDRDLGSAGSELLPGGLLFQAGKNEFGYLIDEATMSSGAPAVYSQKVCKGKVEGEGEGSFGGDAYAAGTIYVPCTDGVRALTYDQAARTFTSLWHGPANATGPPIVSGGLVWVTTGKFLEGGGTKLYGLDPANGKPRYTETLPSPVIDHFGSPSAAGGRVFIATGSTVTAYQIAKVETPGPPAVVTEGATSVTQATATLNATVDPDGSAVSECRFEYGTSTSYTNVAQCASSPGSGTIPVAVSASIGALAANTTYHFRIVARNTGGTSDGIDETLKTLPSPPAVVTSAASSVTESSVTLNATVDPGGAALADCHFDYGSTASYGSAAPCTSLPGVGLGAAAVSAPVTGLAAGTNYYFRIVATNAGGISYGEAMVLTTASPPATLTSTMPPSQGEGHQGVLAFEEQKQPAPEAALLSKSLAASPAGTVTVKLGCSAGTSRCTGTLALSTLSAVNARHRSRRKASILTLAVGSFDIAGGREATVKLRLSASARRLLARTHLLHLRATIVIQDPGGAMRSSQAIVKLRAKTIARR